MDETTVNEQVILARRTAIDALLALAAIEPDLDIRECARMSAADIEYFIQNVAAAR